MSKIKINIINVALLIFSGVRAMEEKITDQKVEPQKWFVFKKLSDQLIQISPDHRYAICKTGDSKNECAIVDTNDETKQEVLHNFSAEPVPVFSPDGCNLAWVDKKCLVILDIEKKTAKKTEAHRLASFELFWASDSLLCTVNTQRFQMNDDFYPLNQKTVFEIRLHDTKKNEYQDTCIERPSSAKFWGMLPDKRSLIESYKYDAATLTGMRFRSYGLRLFNYYSEVAFGLDNGRDPINTLAKDLNPKIFSKFNKIVWAGEGKIHVFDFSCETRCCRTIQHPKTEKMCCFELISNNSLLSVSNSGMHLFDIESGKSLLSDSCKELVDQVKEISYQPESLYVKTTGGSWYKSPIHQTIKKLIEEKKNEQSKK